MRKHRVRALLMGGQACVLYGAAEFSRNLDFVVLAEAANMARLRKALEELQAETIAVPSFDLQHLRRGHSVHFRCRHPEASRMRVDIMARMRGVDSFAKLWKRRTTLTLDDGGRIELLSLPDLVRAKKTQIDKDWPMIRRLVEANFFGDRAKPTAARVRFWFRELRTASLLIDLAARYPELCRKEARKRTLLSLAQDGNLRDLERAVLSEEAVERERDKEYWPPLREELERFRHARFSGRGVSKRGRLNPDNEQRGPEGEAIARKARPT